MGDFASMRFMNSFNRFAGKWMPLIVFCCLTLGVLFHDKIGTLTFLVPYIFAFMTFTGALSASFRQVLDIARHPLPIVAALVIVHVVIPLFALGLGKLFFPGNPFLITGTVLEYVVPTAVAASMWCAMAEGNASLTLSVLLIDTLAAPFVLPFSLHALVGANIKIDVMGMMRDLIWMVALPALASMLINQFSGGRAGRKLTPILAPYGKLALILIIMINSTRVAPFILHMTPTLFGVTAVIFVLAVSGYVAGWLFALLSRQKNDVVASMSLACGMRNISAGAVIAAAYFPPEVMFPVMIGTLFQQLLASVTTRLLIRRQKISA